MGIQCSFALDIEYSLSEIQKNWNLFLLKYPYCIDYETTESIELKDNEIYSINLQEKYQCKTISEYLDEIIKENSFEVAKTRCFGMKKSSLLTTSIINLNNKKYTLFSMYHCHSKTDFKSIVYFVEEFLSFFDESNSIEMKVIPIQSEYSKLLELNCLPSIEKRNQIEKEIQRDILTFNILSLLNKSKFISIENQQKAKEEIKEIIPNCFISQTLKLSKEETKKLIHYAKQFELSIEAVLLSVMLKSYCECFDINDSNMKTISFMIPFDVRKLFGFDEHCIGIFGEGIYPSYPSSFLDLSINEMSKQLTDYIRSITSFDSNTFDRFRDVIYCGNSSLGNIPYTLSLSNMGRFKVMERVSSSLKQHIVDFHLSGCNRFPCTRQMNSMMIHSYLLFDGTCNLSLSYAYSIIPSIIPEIVLNKMYSLLTSLN